MTFNRYYVSYPLCCPSRVSLLTGRYAHNDGVKGNVQPNGGYFGFSFRAAITHNIATWLQGGRLPHDPHRQVPQRLRRRTLRRRHHRAARLGRLAHRAQGRHPPLLLRLHAQQQRRRSKAPTATPAAGKRANTATATTPAAPSRRSNGQPCIYETDLLTKSRRGAARNPARPALLPAARLHRAARRLPPPGRPRAGAAPLRLVQGRAAAPQPLGRLRRGQRQRQAAASSATPTT